MKNLNIYLGSSLIVLLLLNQCTSTHQKTTTFYQHINYTPPQHQIPIKSSTTISIHKQQPPILPTKHMLAVAIESMQQLYEHPQQKQTLPIQALYNPKQIVTQPNAQTTLPNLTPQETITNASDTKDFAKLEKQLCSYKNQSEWQPHKDILDNRINAIKQLKSNQAKNTCNYYLSNKVRNYCNNHSINNDILISCNGNLLQQTIHEEYVTISKNAAQHWHKKNLPCATKNIIHTIADFTNAGSAFNHIGDVHKAITLADTCWIILDCIQAISEGVTEGIHSTIDDLLHPIHTIQNIIQSAETCGYYVGKIIIEVTHLRYLALTDSDATYKKLTAWANNFAIIYAALKEQGKNLKIRDFIKESTSFSMQCYATSKALHGINRLLKTAQKHTAQLAQRINHIVIENTNTLTTPEGITVRIADSAVEYIKINQNSQKSNLATPKTSSIIPDFIQNNRVPIDKETILFDSSFKKTTMPPVKGAKIYKKNEWFYHRDTLHKGKSAHLEVYDKNGKHLGVADPITGELLKNTQNTSKKIKT